MIASGNVFVINFNMISDVCEMVRDLNRKNQQGAGQLILVVGIRFVKGCSPLYPIKHTAKIWL